MQNSTTEYKKLSDEELARMSRTGNERAFETLYNRYAKQVLNYFYRMLRHDKEKAEDLTQELFSKFIHKPERYDASRPFKTWLFSVANNMCKNEYRSYEVRTKAAEYLTARASTATQTVTTDDMDRASFDLKLKEAIDGLDEPRKRIMVLRFFDELSIKEISEQMQCSEGTVKSRIFYTLQGLREQLSDYQGIISWILICLTSINS